MTACNAPERIAPALVMTWRNLQDTAGESITTTWDQWFATFESPTRYRGDMNHGGWSACHCEPSVRADDNVVGLSALVLDYDTGTSIDDAADLWSEHFGLIHTSRKHKPDAPRFRVILPFTRIVTPDEYAIVWRWAQKLATAANQKIDPSTKNPSRFWYVGAKTEHYETRRLGGQPIDPDPIVTSHKYAENERQRATTERAQPQGNIERRASKYLEKLPPSISGSGGHQALWTAALSMVRGFRLSPDRALALLRSEFNPRCQPPWSEKELRHKVDDAEADATTPYGYLADRVREVPQPPPQPDDDYVPEVPGDLVDDGQPPPAPSVSAPRVSSPDNWRAQLNTSPQGHVRNTFDNICRILEHHEVYAALSYDEMRLTPMLGERALNDADVGRIRREIEQNFGFQPSESNIRAAICTVGDARRFHPVRRYLKSLEWDQTERISQLVPDILHAKNTTLHQSIIRKWFISAVARALNPGCKVDTILVLQGNQGARKSTFFEILGGAWFSDTQMDITDKDGLLQLHSAWIYEWGEIEHITTQKHAAHVKAFASSRKDTFRAPFGRTTEVHPRTTVIVGSTNAEQFLADPTGSRRFNVVQLGTKRIEFEILAEWRDQLWAEAVVAYEAGETWWLDDKEDQQRAEANEDFEIDDAWEALIAAWLPSCGTEPITTARILVDGVKMLPGQIGRGAENRIGAVMRRLGYVSHRNRVSGSALRVWRKP